MTTKEGPLQQKINLDKSKLEKIVIKPAFIYEAECLVLNRNVKLKIYRKVKEYAEEKSRIKEKQR